jgi:hypothetical protein
MSAIGPGDWLECVDAVSDLGGSLFDGGFLVHGRIYQVEEVTEARITSGVMVPSVRLVGQPDLHGRSGRRGSYAVSRFRPVYRPNSDFIEALKQPAPERELVDG